MTIAIKNKVSDATLLERFKCAGEMLLRGVGSVPGYPLAAIAMGMAGADDVADDLRIARSSSLRLTAHFALWTVMTVGMTAAAAVVGAASAVNAVVEAPAQLFSRRPDKRCAIGRYLLAKQYTC